MVDINLDLDLDLMLEVDIFLDNMDRMLFMYSWRILVRMKFGFRKVMFVGNDKNC